MKRALFTLFLYGLTLFLAAGAAHHGRVVCEYSWMADGQNRRAQCRVEFRKKW